MGPRHIDGGLRTARLPRPRRGHLLGDLLDDVRRELTDFDAQSLGLQVECLCNRLPVASAESADIDIASHVAQHFAGVVFSQESHATPKAIDFVHEFFVERANGIDCRADRLLGIGGQLSSLFLVIPKAKHLHRVFDVLLTGVPNYVVQNAAHFGCFVQRVENTIGDGDSFGGFVEIGADVLDVANDSRVVFFGELVSLAFRRAAGSCSGGSGCGRLLRRCRSVFCVNVNDVSW